ncbi:hypothetical protein EB118_09105 [bacterium]|nr:hypothetical protein [bacterium]NDD84049.1 hypothetical protein [bacterium]NDG30218.1 hypothetical protein [bacterium]
MKNDFSKFVCFVKGVIETGMVIRHGEKVLRQDAKLHFNRMLNDALQFEKFIHQGLGPEISQFEDDINSLVISLVWQIFDMDKDEIDKFFNYLEKYNDLD